MKVIRGLSLKKYSYLKIGGHCNLLLLEKKADLYQCSIIINKDDFKIIGHTSKIIFPDSDYQGYLVRFIGQKRRLNKNILNVESGVKLSVLAYEMVKKRYKGFSGLVGIPGDLGGAICNNAGAFNEEISSFVTKVKVYDLIAKKKFVLSKEECQFAYRSSIFKQKPHLLIYEIVFGLEKSSKELEKKAMEQAILLRKKSQPCHGRSLGSIFKNPKNGSAGKLLEDCFGRGFQGQNIALSQQHANFFIVNELTSAENILSFIDILYTKVYNEKEVSLEKEVIVFRW